MEKRPLRIAVAIPKERAARLQNYFDALRQAGAEPAAVDETDDLAPFDGLLLPGGGDLNPRLYGEELCGSEPFDAGLDRLQWTALDRFVKAGKPVLGICRGMQLINVYFGGTLIQHLPTTAAHRMPPGGGDQVHAVRAEAGSLLRALYGERFATNSSHHQAVGTPGDGLAVTARCPDDGVIEAVECPGKPIFAVQFHPERMAFAHARPDTADGGALFARFLAACESHRGA